MDEYKINSDLTINKQTGIIPQTGYYKNIINKYITSAYLGMYAENLKPLQN